MGAWTRRAFLGTSAVGGLPLLTELGALGQLDQASAQIARFDPAGVRPTPSIKALVGLIHKTPHEQCVAIFIQQLRDGLSYQDFLAALFLASIEQGDPHYVAAVYSAHRVASEAAATERLLPLFWALDRLSRGFAQDPPKPRSLLESESKSATSELDFRNSMEQGDSEKTAAALIALSQDRGPRQALSLLWEYSARRVDGTLGHHPIMMANSWRTLEALGWGLNEPVLRYLATSFSGDEADRCYQVNRERAAQAVGNLPASWAKRTPARFATLEVYRQLREGHTDATLEHVNGELVAGRVSAGAIWDAIHLAAADLLFRYRTGGLTIGGFLIHSVTGTNALRYGFETCADDRVRFLLLLQAIPLIGDLFIHEGRKEDDLRPLDLAELQVSASGKRLSMDDIFAILPTKMAEPREDDRGASRDRSDEACRAAFALLQSEDGQAHFQQYARSLLCRKATDNPHDFKYPVAAFEDVSLVSPDWRPYLLAASVHALHGVASPDAKVLIQAKAALAS